MNKTYLGDGVYVQFDGYALVLTTEDGIRTTNSIYLEPDIYRALVRYVDGLRKAADASSCVCHRGSICTAACTAHHHSGCPYGQA